MDALAAVAQERREGGSRHTSIGTRLFGRAIRAYGPHMTKSMRVFVTGATGWIGTAVLKELRGAGHSVLGMAHSDAGADKLKAQGVEVVRGDLRDPRGLVEGVRATDATIHLAFHMDFSDFPRINQIDRDAIRAMLDAMAGTNKAFVGTNGTLVVSKPGKVALEADESPASSPLSVRLQAERLVVDAAKRGVRGSVIRLAPTVHGAGDKGFIAMLIDIAREKKAAGYVDEGNHHWPAVHRDDAARLYRLAVESAPPGSVLHGTAEEGITMRAIAEAISKGTGAPTKSVPAAEAGAHFGWMSMVVGLDNRTSSEATRELLGWKPEQPGLLDDMRAHYF
ncbi:SDR family oxidoreductase [Sorangium atrum]|uniref:SDR family oxidoreductase n=1 Tax=Sorangium atrum TaxID=2995308 RepID=A0ABT5C9F9_9BACT|nr:SDR family oxidoreductase [Sorangium aterium]MDC0683068.1 SDR family oxidoreductase [Sorangium aterium]